MKVFVGDAKFRKLKLVIDQSKVYKEPFTEDDLRKMVLDRIDLWIWLLQKEL